MAINYIPNDPLVVGDAPMRVHTPRPDRPAGRAGFHYYDTSPAARYPAGTAEFLFWQCSEAALAAMEVWDELDGPPRRWATRKYLDLLQDAGTELNAYYDRRSLSFFKWTTGSKTTYSGASVDVVAHETGHALLDIIRPDLWDSYFTETNAFHEAFADCIAILTALHDRKSREAMLSVSPDLWSEHFLEATAEDLSDGVRREYGPQHPASAPRHAYNWFSWQLPSTLPTVAPPATLSSEIHSFGQVFSGCFYDVIGLMFALQSQKNQQSLWNVARTAAKLLIAAARSAPEVPRFFQAVGRAMILADEDQNGGANHWAIRAAFNYHDIYLGSSAMLAPTAALPGPTPRFSAAPKSILSATTRKDVLRRIGAVPRAASRVQTVRIGRQRVAQVVHQRDVSLSPIDSRLRGVVAEAAEPVLVGRSGRSAAILGALPEAEQTRDEVTSFVRALVDHDCIEFKRRRGTAAAGRAGRVQKPTHRIKAVRGKRVLTRVRMADRW
jgi:hypothetical protein